MQPIGALERCEGAGMAGAALERRRAEAPAQTDSEQPGGSGEGGGRPLAGPLVSFPFGTPRSGGPVTPRIEYLSGQQYGSAQAGSVCPCLLTQAQQRAAYNGVRLGEAAHPGPPRPPRNHGGSSQAAPAGDGFWVEGLSGPTFDPGPPFAHLEEGWTQGYWEWVATTLSQNRNRGLLPYDAFCRVLAARLGYRARWVNRRSHPWAEHRRADLCLLLWLLDCFPAVDAGGNHVVGVPPLDRALRLRLVVRNERLLRLVEFAARQDPRPLWLQLLCRATEDDGLFEAAVALWRGVRLARRLGGARFTAAGVLGELGDRRSEVAVAAYGAVPPPMDGELFVAPRTGEDRTGLGLRTCPDWEAAFEAWIAEEEVTIWGDPFLSTPGLVMRAFLFARHEFERDFFEYCQWGVPAMRHSRADVSRFLAILREPCWGILPSPGWFRHRTWNTRLWTLYWEACLMYPQCTVMDLFSQVA